MRSRADLELVEPTQLQFGAGSVEFSPITGAPAQFRNPLDAERRYLLDAQSAWHSVEHEWGSGHLVTSAGAGRWNTPREIYQGAGGTEVRFNAVAGLALTVRRKVEGARLVESYDFRNDTAAPVTVTALGIQTPFADLYESSATALRAAVHAHVFTGGDWAWVAAQPMSGRGPVLGLVLTAGSLTSYSVESRNVNTLSNARGHLVLNVTDAARNQLAFGGQPEITVAAGQGLQVEWAIGWYDTVDAVAADSRPAATFSRLAAPIGETIRVRARAGVVVTAPSHARVSVDGDAHVITGTEHGVLDLQIGSARTRVLFHLGVEELVRRRVRYILDRQRSVERAGVLAFAFVPVDTSTGLTSSTNGWSDWTDGSERIAMPILLQLAAERGWADRDEVDTAIDGWLRFARKYLLDEALTPRRGSQDSVVRLYDSPWLVEVFLNRYRVSSNPDDLWMAVRILDRADQLGGTRHLAIGRSRTIMAVAEELDRAGVARVAERLRVGLVETADYFLEMGEALPEHEVAYEQAIVAPLLDLLIDAHRITGSERHLTGIRERLPWLLAFGGAQPDVRTYGIALRHWDGYWFGASRLFGDVFPHYWSALTAVVLARLPNALKTKALDELASAILAANLANFRADGSATCAFVMPSTVDGRPGYREDPLANDQDWHLALWLDLSRREGVDLE